MVLLARVWGIPCNGSLTLVCSHGVSSLCAAKLTVNGNTILGSDNSDTVTVNAPSTFEDTLTVQGNTVLGKASSGATTEITGPATLDSTLAVTGERCRYGVERSLGRVSDMVLCLEDARCHG